MAKKSYNNGNNFALKWSLTEIEKKVKELMELLTESKEGEKIIYIGEALSNVGLYKDAWAYFSKVVQEPIGCKAEDESKGSRDKREDVFRMIKKVEDLMQARLVEKALGRKVSTPMAIFILKNQGWSDQQQHDITTGGEKIESVPTELRVRVINSNEKIHFNEDGSIKEDKT